VLDRLGLKYEVRHTDRGNPYAGLRLAVDTSDLVNLTTQLRGDVFQITAHSQTRFDSTEDGLAHLNGFNQGWGLGSAYRHSDSGYVEVSLGAYLHGAQPEVSGVMEALRVVSATCQRVVSAPDLVDEQLGRLVLAIQTNTYPTMESETVMREMAHAMAEAGSPMRGFDDSVLVERFYENDDHVFVVEIRELDGKYLQVRSWNEPHEALSPDRGTLSKLQDLNLYLSAGAIVLDQVQMRSYWLVRIPFAWIRIGAGLAHWILDTAALASEAIAQRLEGPKGNS
jgi:hypothetical protein